MPNRMEQGATRLATRLKASAGTTVIYSRGATASDSITGVQAQQTYEIQDEQGITAEIHAHDWTFLRSDLTLAGLPINPRKGDTIAATLNGAAVVFKVATIGSRPCYEWLDTSGIMILVHTLVDDE